MFSRIGLLQGEERKLHQKIQKKISKVESAKTEENSHHAWVMRILKVLCEFRITPCVVRNFRTTWSSWLPKAISSSFQLQIVYGLKRWILDFQTFEMVYSMQKMDFGKCSKSMKEDCSCCPLCFSSLCLLFLFASLCFSPFIL